MMAFCSVVFASEPCVRRLQTRYHGNTALDQLEWDDDTWAEFERHQPIGRSNPNIHDTGGAGDAGTNAPNSVSRRLDMGPGARTGPNGRNSTELRSDVGPSSQPPTDTVPDSQPVWQGRGRAICNSTSSLQHQEREIR